MPNMDVGIIVLCPETNKKNLKYTCCSAKHHLYNREVFAVVPKNSKSKQVAELKNICTVYKAKNTVTSLINTGMKRLKHEWACLVFSGSLFRAYAEKKFEFAERDNELLFPVYDSYYDFIQGPFNGILINKKFFNVVGDFQDVSLNNESNDFEMAKALWGNDFLKIGGVMKGIVGMRME